MDLPATDVEKKSKIINAFRKQYPERGNALQNYGQIGKEKGGNSGKVSEIDDVLSRMHPTN